MSNSAAIDTLEERIKAYLRQIPRLNFTDNGFKNIAYRFDVSEDYLMGIVIQVQSERTA